MELATLGTYLGIPCHHWDDELPLIGTILDELCPLTTVEIGTMHGGFAAFLADKVRVWNGMVYTVDNVVYPGWERAIRDNLTFISGDIFDPAIQGQLIKILDRYPRRTTLLYCDGPPGRPELNLFGNYAGIVGVHDYGTDADPKMCYDWAERAYRFPHRQGEFELLQEKHGGYFVSRFWVLR